MRLVIANVGERDLYYDIGTPDDPWYCALTEKSSSSRDLAAHLAERHQIRCRRCTRDLGAALRALVERNGPEELRRCHYPILRPVLEQARAEGRVDRLILVATDQPEAVGEFYWSDTIHSAHLLSLLVRRDTALGINAVQMWTCSDRPHLDGPAYAFFRARFAELASDVDDECIAEISGGTPAMRRALQGHVVARFATRARIYTVDPPTEAESIAGAERGTLQREVADPYLRELIRSLARRLLDRYDFAGALELLGQFAGVRFWPDEVEHALEHAVRRIDLNITGAAQAIQAEARSEESGSAGDSGFLRWYRATNGSQGAFRAVADSVAIAAKRYETRDYAEVLWRAIAVYEVGLRMIVAILFPRLKLEDELTSAAIAAAGLGEEWEQDLLEQARLAAGAREPWKVSGRLLAAICACGLRSGDPSVAASRAAYDQLQLLVPLYRYRNELLHLLRPVTTTKLNQHLRNRDRSSPAPLLTVLQRALLALKAVAGRGDPRDGEDQFAQISAYVLAQLQEPVATP